MGAERETRRGANVLYSGGDRLHSAQGEADFANRTRRLAWTSVRHRVLSLHCEDRMNSILTIKCTIVVLLLVVGVVGT